MARESNSFTLLLRYQAQAERHYRRAIEEFDRLKALRGELPNEPITDPDLEQKETTYPDSSGRTLQACPVGQASACQSAEQPHSPVEQTVVSSGLPSRPRLAHHRDRSFAPSLRQRSHTISSPISRKNEWTIEARQNAGRCVSLKAPFRLPRRLAGSLRRPCMVSQYGIIGAWTGTGARSGRSSKDAPVFPGWTLRRC
jgi:hypothetical protein